MGEYAAVPHDQKVVNLREYVIGLAWQFLSSHRRPPTTLHRPIKRCCKLDDDDEVGMSEGCWQTCPEKQSMKEGA